MIFFSNSIKFRQTLSFSFIVLINFIFAYKYFSRSLEHALLLSIFYITLLIIIFILSKKFSFQLYESDWFYYAFVFMYIAGHVILFHFIHVENLNVDRWSVISAFWEQAFKGEYPYNAQSHMGNYAASLPFYFVLALPFYLIGEIGYFSLIGIIIFAFFLRKNLSRSESICAIFILFLSVSVFWEISVRSTIFVNTVLFMLYLFWLLRIDLNNKKQYWTSAIIGGLLLSTREIFALPLIIYCVFLLKSKEISVKSLVGWCLIVFGLFIFTFSPFLIFYFHEFLNRNPFRVQTEQLLPFRISAFFLILAVIAGLLCSDKMGILYCSVCLFVSILMTYYALFIHNYGLMPAYLKSYIDLSYMLFAFPFLLFFSFKGGVLKHKK